MRWAAFVQTQPRLGRIGQQRLIDPGVALLVTVRRDGTGRLSPLAPYVLDGELYLSTMPNSATTADMVRDDRVLLHGIVTAVGETDGELKLRGRAHIEQDPYIHGRYAASVGSDLGWEPVPGRFRLFRVDLEQVTLLRRDPGSGDQYVTRWPSGDEYVRRGTSATTVGPAEPVHGVLV